MRAASATDGAGCSGKKDDAVLPGLAVVRQLVHRLICQVRGLLAGFRFEQCDVAIDNDLLLCAANLEHRIDVDETNLERKGATYIGLEAIPRKSHLIGSGDD